MNELEFTINKCTIEQIHQHLSTVDEQFVPPLNSYVDIKTYSQKIGEYATRFEIQSSGILVGLIAAYFNEDSSYVSNFTIEQNLTGKGAAQQLLSFFERYCIDKKCQNILLEVFKTNTRAINFYTKNKFYIKTEKVHQFVLEKKI